jgi:hypothetical protein
MADNKTMTKRERDALDRENSGNTEQTMAVIAGRVKTAELRAEATKAGK